MAYDALTIDAQTVYENGRYLDRGLVAQLSQYKDGITQVVLSEVVVRELRAMLMEKAKTTHDALTKAIKEGRNNCHLSKEQITHLRRRLLGFKAPSRSAVPELVRPPQSQSAPLLNLPAKKQMPLSCISLEIGISNRFA